MNYGPLSNFNREWDNPTSDGGYVIVGTWGMKCSGGTCTQGATWLLKANAEGDTLWTRAYGELGAGDYCWCVRETTEEGYILAGYTTTYGTGPINLWLIKTDSLGLVVTVDEEPVVDAPADWQVLSPIGQMIVLRYKDRPEGFHASVFDATGRKVDELHATESSGMITWGKCYGCYGCYGPGVYFIRPSSGNAAVRKVILVE